MAICYGYETLEKDDPFVSDAEELNSLARYLAPGALAVNHLPFRELFLPPSC